MASTTSDTEQQKLLQIFTPFSAQAVNVSLRDEDEHRRPFSTGTKHSPTESEAAIGMDTTSGASPVRVEGVSIWTHESHIDRCADPDQQPPLQTNHTSAGDTTACTNASFGVSTTSPESHPCLGVLDEQLLVTEATGATSEPGIMMIDALSDEESCHRAQSTRASSSMRTYSPIAATPEEMAQTLLNDSELRVSTSRDDSTPGARNSSSAVRLSSESRQEPDFDHTNRRSSDAESESSEVESGSPFGARVSPPSHELPSRRRSRRRSPHAHTMVQDKDSDVDTEDSISEDGLGVQECVRDEDYCPSSPKIQRHDSGDDSGDKQHGRKRRRVSRSPHTSVRSTPASARSSRQRRSTRHTAQLLIGRRTSACGIESQTPSQAMLVPSEASTLLARFEEWPLRDVSLKRITEGDKTTFQLQFEWTPDLSQPHADRSVSHPTKDRGPPKASLSATRSSGGKWTTEEDDTVRTMRQAGRSWAEIQRALPHRSQGTVQVRYSTKLNQKVLKRSHIRLA